MRKILTYAAIAFQLLVLFYMAAGREYIVRNGTKVSLRTAPIDPNDPFRGDFVRLNYEISNVPSGAFKTSPVWLKDENYARGNKVYTVLKEDENGVWHLDYCTEQMPDNGVFIKGFSDYNWRFSRGRAIHLKYGIETFFVQQGKGLDIEKRAGNRNSIQVPLDMEVALGRNGTGIVTGYRWSPIGIGLEILETPQQNNSLQRMFGNEQDGEKKDLPDEKTPRKTIKIRITLLNASSSPLAIVNLPDSRSFSLEPTLGAEEKWRLAKTFPDPVQPDDGDIIVLKPEEKHSFDFDFADPRWFVCGDKTRGPVEIGCIGNQWNNMFRIIYRPPTAEQCAGLKNADLIWHGFLPSRAFNGSGNVD